MERHVGLGGTGVTHRALASGAIDLYPEYTGTLGRVILKDPGLVAPRRDPRAARADGLTMTARSASRTPTRSRCAPRWRSGSGSADRRSRAAPVAARGVQLRASSSARMDGRGSSATTGSPSPRRGDGARAHVSRARGGRGGRDRRVLDRRTARAAAARRCSTTTAGSSPTTRRCSSRAATSRSGFRARGSGCARRSRAGSTTAAMARSTRWPTSTGRPSREVAAAFAIGAGGREAPAAAARDRARRATLEHLVLVLVARCSRPILVGVPIGSLAARVQACGQVELSVDRDAADDSRAGAADVHDPAVRHRQRAGARGALPLRALADRPRRPRRSRRGRPAAARDRVRPRAGGAGGGSCAWSCRWPRSASWRGSRPRW